MSAIGRIPRLAVLGVCVVAASRSAAPAPLSAPVSPLACSSATGENATVVIRASVVAPGLLAQGDVLRAYAASGRCVGKVSWAGGAGVALTLWGDDVTTPGRDGLAEGEAFELRAVHDGTEVALAATWALVLSAPPGTGAEYYADAVYVVGALSGQGQTPEVQVALAPQDPPVVIPAGGGPFAYTFSVTNPTTEPQTVDAWTRAVRPDGRTLPVLLGPVTVTLPSGASASRVLRHRVPAGMMPGDWTYTGYVGTFPGGATDSSSFTITVEGSGGRIAQDGGADWATAAYAEDGAPVKAGDVWVGEAPEAPEAPEAAATLPEAFVLHGPRPNPASSQATLAFELAEAGRVRIAVYDLLGREVAVLVDDHREAGRYEAVLERRGLPSGTYLARMWVTGAAGTVTRTQRVTLVP